MTRDTNSTDLDPYIDDPLDDDLDWFAALASELDLPLTDDLSDVEKHLPGQHDQKSHGRRGAAGGDDTGSAGGETAGLASRLGYTPGSDADVNPTFVRQASARAIHYMRTEYNSMADNLIDSDPDAEGRIVETIGTFDEFQQACLDVTRLSAEHPQTLGVFVPPQHLDAIAADGRLKSQFETEHSQGWFDPAKRAEVESYQMGAPEDLDPEARPIYGAALDDLADYPFDAGAHHYGDTFLVLDKGAVAGRTTLAFGDTLDQTLVPIPVGDGVKSMSDDRLRAAMSDAWVSNVARSYYASRTEDYDASPPSFDVEYYTEIQVHGGVKLSDVEAVLIRESPLNTGLLDLPTIRDLERTVQVSIGESWESAYPADTWLTENGYDYLLKHLPGRHNQLTHGRGGTAGLITSLTSGGGATVSTGPNKRALVRRRGKAVSPYPDRSAQVPAASLTIDHVRAYIAANVDLLSRPGHHVGTWRDRDTDTVWLDVSIVLPTHEAAAKIGKQFNQKAYYDLNTGETVSLGGTGEAT